VNSGRGTCSNANTCVCNSGYTGSVCQTGNFHLRMREGQHLAHFFYFITHVLNNSLCCIVIETTGFKDFTARSQHSMAYDPSKDMVYITGGTSSVTSYMGDILTYTFGKSLGQVTSVL
jgi:hypothetical protein